jgi:hypothetical protein
MADLLAIVARLRAFEAGRAVPTASHRQSVLQPHALIVCLIAMAGEDTTVHAIAVGRIAAPPQVRVVPDPRIRDEHYALFEWFGGIVEAYFAECRAAGDFPQIWVSSGAAAGHLDTLADRLRFTRDQPAVRRLGELLSYATERYPVAGQQALVPATHALRSHYATGQQEGEDEHLGTLLTWINPPTGRDVIAAATMAEREPMGVKTDPEFDRRELQPLVAAYDEARRRNASSREIARRATAIEQVLGPVVRHIYAAVQQAIAILGTDTWQPAGMVAELAAQEADEFRAFMESRDQGHFLPYRDKPKAAAFKITARESAVENTEAAAVHGDRVARTKAVVKGKVLRGTVRASQATRVGRRTEFRFEVETTQRSLHLRRHDDLYWLADPKLCCTVTGVRRQRGTTYVALVVTKGMRVPGSPVDGAAVDFGPKPANWFWLGKERQKMAARLAREPWTHTDQLPAGQPAGRPRPASLVRAVESVR